MVPDRFGIRWVNIRQVRDQRGLAWDTVGFNIGCPRNNHIFFRFKLKETKLNLFRLFFGLFRFVSVFRTSMQTTETLRILSKQTVKTFSIRGSSKPLFFFSVRTETNRNSVCFGCYSVCFLAKPPNFFSVCFDVSDRYWNNWNKQDLWDGELKRLIF
jgi:hypothetical protein